MAREVIKAARGQIVISRNLSFREESVNHMAPDETSSSGYEKLQVIIPSGIIDIWKLVNWESVRL
jgi:hypothetical protein